MGRVQEQFRVGQRREACTSSPSSWRHFLLRDDCPDICKSQAVSSISVLPGAESAFWKRTRESRGLRGSSTDGILMWQVPNHVTKVLGHKLQGPLPSLFFLRHRYHGRRRTRTCSWQLHHHHHHCHHHHHLINETTWVHIPTILATTSLLNIYFLFCASFSCIVQPRHENLLLWWISTKSKWEKMWKVFSTG